MISNSSRPLKLIACSIILFASGLTWTTTTLAFEPFIGTIRYFGFNFPPRGWAHCDGQLLAVAQNDALFALLGTTYGGDGRTTFGLPDMRGRLPIHVGSGPGLTPRSLGAKGGQETVTLTLAQLPSHNHSLEATNTAGNQTSPENHVLANDGNDETYIDVAPNTAMHADSVTVTGGSRSHENMSPFIGVYCNIALVGIFPPRN